MIYALPLAAVTIEKYNIADLANKLLSVTKNYLILTRLPVQDMHDEQLNSDS